MSCPRVPSQRREVACDRPRDRLDLLQSARRPRRGCFDRRRFRATLLPRRGQAQPDKRRIRGGARSPLLPSGRQRRLERGRRSDPRGDQPILSGLRYILDRGRELDEGNSDPDPAEDWRVPTPSFNSDAGLGGSDAGGASLPHSLLQGGRSALVNAPCAGHKSSPCISAWIAGPRR